MSVLTATFNAPSLDRKVPVTVIYPEERQEPCPVLYLLHGLHGSEWDWVTRTRVGKLAETAGLCVVMPAGENMFYADSAVTGNYYGRFICEDLPRFIESTFRVIPERDKRYIAGLSMGGYGALVNGLRRPDVFSRIGAFSSGLIKEHILNSTDEPGSGIRTRTQFAAMFGLKDVSDFPGSEHDYDALARQRANDSHRPAIYLTCGTEDSLYAPNLAFHELLNGLGYRHVWESRPGDHNWDFWDTAVEKFIAMLGE